MQKNVIGIASYLPQLFVHSFQKIFEARSENSVILKETAENERDLAFPKNKTVKTGRQCVAYRNKLSRNSFRKCQKHLKAKVQNELMSNFVCVRSKR